jgi:hypothetical protein
MEAAMRHFVTAMAVCLCLAFSLQARALDIEYPQVIRTRYEAADVKTGGKALSCLIFCISMIATR